MKSLSLVGAVLLISAPPTQSASYYSQRLLDANAVYVTAPPEGDSTVALQQAIDQVQERTGQGIVFLAAGRYAVTNTIHVWPGIRIIGYGPTRPVVWLPANTPGYGDEAQEKIVLFFAGGRPADGRGRRPVEEGQRRVPDANPGTFYSAAANIDIEIASGNGGAVGVRAKYAQHCFLAHMDFRLGAALAGIHEAGNVVEDVRFFGGRYGIWTAKPSPGWQFTVIDSSFEGQREAAILEREAGLTLIRPQFRRVPTAVALEANQADELWVKDAVFEDISGPAFTFGLENNPRNEINLENITCRSVPLLALLRDSAKRYEAPAPAYRVSAFSHGLHLSDTDGTAEIKTWCEMSPASAIAPVTSDIPDLPVRDTWVNLRDFGAKGDGASDDTEIIRSAIAQHRTIYCPTGFYVVRDTLQLQPGTVLIGLHPGATQFIVPDGTPAFQGPGAPKALLETPRGGSNIVIGIGLYTSGNNPRAVAALWRAGANSLMNDVRFLGGHGTPKPDGSRENPYNNTHSADPDPARRWDSQYPSLWVTDGGGGTFLDIWTPSTFAQAGMLVSNTECEGRVYQMSSEHHVRYEVQLRQAAHWRFYALQTEAERGESGLALQVEVDSCQDIAFSNLHIYRVISSTQPFPWAVKVSNSRDIRFRNFHAYSNSKVSYDSAVYDQTHQREIRHREFAWLNLTGQPTPARRRSPSSTVVRGAKVEKLAGGFHNISGGAAGPNGDFFFVDAHWQRVYRWNAGSRQLATLSDFPTQPVNLLTDNAGNLVVVSYAGKGLVYALGPDGTPLPLAAQPVSEQADTRFFLPVTDWRLNRDSLSHPAAHFLSPDGSTVLPAGADFLHGAMSWGVKSSPPIRSFGLAPVRAGQKFYVSDEAGLTTWSALVGKDGSLADFTLFAEQGGEGVAVDIRGYVYLAAGQIYVYRPEGQLEETIEVPERPVQLVFGGPDRRTLFIPARTSLYSVRTRHAGR